MPFRFLNVSSRRAGVLAAGAALCWAAPAPAQDTAPDAPLFHVVPNNRSMAGAPGAAPSTPAPGDVPSIAVSSSLNVLILALDEADINAARFMNVAPNANDNVPDLPPPPAAAPNNAVPRGGGRVFRLPKTLPAQPDATQPAPPDFNILPQGNGANNDDNKAAPAPIAPAAWNGVLRSPQVRWIASAQQIPALPSLDDSSVDLPSRRTPGRAQAVAEPLRRALNAAGFRDVLTTALDGPSVLRSINSGRISIQVADALRFATGQMLDAAKVGAGRFSAQPGVVEDLPVTPPAPNLAQARQSAIAAASRIGLSLGYRAVVVLAVAPDAEANGNKTGAVYSLLVVDAPHESGDAFLLHQDGASAVAVDGSAANAAAQNLASQLRAWPAFSQAERAAQVEKHMTNARAALQKGDLATVRDQLNWVVALDASNVEAYVLLGDALQNSDAVAAARAYQRAAEINTQSGEVWAKIAITHTLSNPPDWVRSLQAASRAQQLGYDSANLRIAMAGAEFGRAELFRRSGRTDQAEDAEVVAKRHLDRARELAPDSPEVTAGVSRLMGKYLLDQKRYREAVQSLELLAVQYPNDLQTQTMYARALEGMGKRDEDTFLAWSKVWKLSGESEVPLEASRYAVIADGFDQRAVNILKNIYQLTYGVSTGAILRETAILQTNRAKTDLQAAITTLQLMRPPTGRSTSDAHVNRLFAADLMTQALEYYSIYLETGNDLNRTRGVETHRAAIESLNLARGGNAAGATTTGM